MNPHMYQSNYVHDVLPSDNLPTSNLSIIHNIIKTQCKTVQFLQALTMDTAKMQHIFWLQSHELVIVCDISFESNGMTAVLLPVMFCTDCTGPYCNDNRPHTYAIHVWFILCISGECVSGTRDMICSYLNPLFILSAFAIVCLRSIPAISFRLLFRQWCILYLSLCTLKNMG